jgi:hypothetical protein
MGEKVELLEDHADFAADGIDVLQGIIQFNSSHNDSTSVMLFQPVDAMEHG